jgi:hypothetical protein
MMLSLLSQRIGFYSSFLTFLRNVSMTQRISEVVRNTNETKIRVRLNLDGTGQGTLNTGVPFLDHMIDQIKRHGLFDIDIHCDGDLKLMITIPLKIVESRWVKHLHKL